MRAFWFLTCLWATPWTLLVLFTLMYEPSYLVLGRVLGLAALIFIPPALLYLAGSTLAWLIRGFEEPRDTAPPRP
jgi:hypothetical protein